MFIKRFKRKFDFDFRTVASEAELFGTPCSNRFQLLTNYFVLLTIFIVHSQVEFV